MGNTHIADAVNEIYRIFLKYDIIFLKVELKDNIDCIFKP